MQVKYKYNRESIYEKISDIMPTFKFWKFSFRETKHLVAPK